MSEFFSTISAILKVPLEHQGFFIAVGAMMLAGYSIYAVLSITRGR